MRAIAAFWFILAACSGDAPIGPAAAGSVRVDVTTSGIDRDGVYQVRVGDESREATMGVPRVEVTGLGAGTHEVSLLGVAENCSVSGQAVRSIEVIPGNRATVAFAVSCVATTGAIRASVQSSGADLDPNGFRVQIGPTLVQAIGINGVLIREELDAGDHEVTLSGLAPNCTVGAPNPRILKVTIGEVVRDTARTVFAVTCVPLVGTVRVTTQTTGSDPDPDGYLVVMDGTRGCQRPWIAVVQSDGSDPIRLVTGIVFSGVWRR
jgi:hypothetical protein